MRRQHPCAFVTWRPEFEKLLAVNCNSGIGLDSWWTDIYEKREAYTLSLAARVASALFGVPYAITNECVIINLARLD